MSELRSHLDDKQIQFGCFSVLGVDDRGTTQSTRTKYVSFSFAGPGCSMIKRARISVQRDEVNNVFTGCAVSVQWDDADSVSAEDVNEVK